MSGSVRLVTGVIPWLESNDAMLLFYAGCVCEVLFTTLGVADRFMAIRRQRDEARFEADMFERLSERDALTGLLNRRAIERDFETYRAEGYRALAVLDLDHFKAINDVHGHEVGDAVLKAVAAALQPDPQLQAFRLGGEEFLLLVRGEDAHLRAERRRQAIPAAVSNAVPALGYPVTASMGMTDAPADADTGFTELYRQADKLLYDAKPRSRWHKEHRTRIRSPAIRAFISTRSRGIRRSSPIAGSTGGFRDDRSSLSPNKRPRKETEWTSAFLVAPDYPSPLSHWAERHFPMSKKKPDGIQDRPRAAPW
jgi:diguanylate cyclase (GGDEF)-like protein